MNKITAFFYNTFKRSFFIILTLGFLLRIIPFSIALITSKNNLDISLWITETIYGLLLVSLFSLVIPWISLSFYGEYFYTRSLNRKDIFKIFRNEHLKYLSILVILLYTSIIFYNRIVQYANEKINFNTSLFFISVTIFISLIIAGNTATLKTILKYSIPILIISPFLSSYYVNGYNIINLIFIGIWLIYLFCVYKVISNYDNDIDLNVAGKIDDENRALSNMWIFSKEFGLKKSELSKPNIFSSFKLLVANTSNIYIQLFLIINLIILYFSIKDFYYSYIELSNKTINQNNDISLLSILSFAFIGIFILINPKYLTLQVEEFLFSRAVSKTKIYFSNFIFQASFILFLILLDFIFPSINFFSQINTISFILTCIWFLIAGEMGIFLFISLFITDFTFEILKSNIIANTSTSLLVNILSPNINGLLVWFSAILFRLLDYKWFISKEIGFIKETKRMIKSLSKLYITSFVISISLSLVAIYNNPYTKFINSTSIRSKYNWNLISSDTVFALFNKNRDESQESIYKFIQEPYKVENIINFSRKYYIDKFYCGSVVYGRYKLANSYSDFNENIEYLLDLSKSLENTPEYNYQKSVLYKFSNNYDKAYEFAIKSVKNNNDNFYLFNLADIYRHELKNKEAIDVYKKVSKYKKSRDFNPLKEIGKIYWFNNDYNKAIDYYADSLLKEGSILANYNYYYLGLCDKLKEIKNNPKYSNILNINRDIKNYLRVCSNELTSFNNTYSNSFILDYAKKAENNGDLIRAEYLLSTREYLANQTNLAYLSLVQAKLGKKEIAQKSIDKYFERLKFYKEYIRNRTFYLYRSYFDSDIYKTLLMLNNNNDKTLEFAKNFILTSNNTDKASGLK
ncbi:MAG: hypothetical protein U0354_06595 [Candidatus Sericytochromatia bacterium]